MRNAKTLFVVLGISLVVSAGLWLSQGPPSGSLLAPHTAPTEAVSREHAARLETLARELAAVRERLGLLAEQEPRTGLGDVPPDAAWARAADAPPAEAEEVGSEHERSLPEPSEQELQDRVLGRIDGLEDEIRSAPPEHAESDWARGEIERRLADFEVSGVALTGLDCGGSLCRVEYDLGGGSVAETPMDVLSAVLPWEGEFVYHSHPSDASVVMVVRRDAAE